MSQCLGRSPYTAVFPMQGQSKEVHIMPRIPLITPESDLDAEQKRVLQGLLGRRGGRIPGPYRFTLHSPEITELMHPFGEALRMRSTFPLRLSELAVIITARMWDCDYV